MSLKYMDDASNYYIHFNKMNIGKRAPGAAINFAAQKQVVAQQLQGQFMKLASNNIKIKTPEGFARALDVNDVELMNTIDQQLKAQLQRDISVDKLQKLHSIVQTNDISSLLKNAIDPKGFQDFQKALKYISQCLHLLESGNGSLGSLLLQASKDGTDLTSIGKNLSAALETYKVQQHGKLIKRETLEAAKNQLNNLATALSTGYFKSGNALTAKGLSTLLLNGLISTNIAEGLAFSMNAKANSLLKNTIVHSVGSKAHISGDLLEKDIQKVTGKADISLENVRMSLNGTGEEIILNLGISSKFYTGQKFNVSNDGNLLSSGTFGSGSGWTLGAALKAIFGGNTAQEYLGYNYMAHGINQQGMNDLIATRQLLRLFSTTGSSKDFSMYMLVNGELVSMWQMVQYAMSSSLALSKSMSGSSNQAIVLTIPERSSITSPMTKDLLDQPGETPEVAAWNRSRKKNAEINKARIYAELRLHKLVQMI